MKTTYAIACLALLANLAVAQASPVDVSYTVSGSAGNWLYDFSVTNNLPANEIYSFGVVLNTTNRVGTPTGWDPGAVGVNWFNNGGSNTNYNNTWVTCVTASCPAGHPPSDIDPGQTLSGFQVLDSGQTALTGVSWYVTSFGNNPIYSGPGCSFNCSGAHDNPGFEGVASVSAVPLPAAAWFFGSGLLGLVGVARRKAS